MNTSQTQTCRRCGQCCNKGGPALHGPDTACFGEGGLAMADLVTLRPGELVHDQPTGKILQLDAEVVKIRSGKKGQACRFYRPADRSCGIYAKRPEECRILECAAPEPLKEMYEKDRLSRRDLLPEGHSLLELLDAHDAACSPEKLAALCKTVLENGNKNAAETIGEMLAYDAAIRTQITTRTGIAPEATHFLFGRPLTDILTSFGLQAKHTATGYTLSKNPFTRTAK